MSKARVGIGFIFLALLVMLILLRTFQVVQISSGNEIVFHFARISALLTLLSAILLLISAVLFAIAKIGIGRLFALLPLFIGLIIFAAAYGMFTDHLVVGSTRLLLPSRGFPFHGYEQLQYDQISMLTIQIDSTRQDDQKPNYVFNFQRTDGSTVIVPIGDLGRSAMQSILAALKQRQIPIIDRSED